MDPTAKLPSMWSTGRNLKSSLNARTTAAVSQLCFGFKYTLAGDPYLNLKWVNSGGALFGSCCSSRAPELQGWSHTATITPRGSATCGSTLYFNASAPSTCLLQQLLLFTASASSGLDSCHVKYYEFLFSTPTLTPSQRKGQLLLSAASQNFRSICSCQVLWLP